MEWCFSFNFFVWLSAISCSNSFALKFRPLSRLILASILNASVVRWCWINQRGDSPSNLKNYFIIALHCFIVWIALNLRFKWSNPKEIRQTERQRVSNIKKTLIWSILSFHLGFKFVFLLTKTLTQLEGKRSCQSLITVSTLERRKPVLQIPCTWSTSHPSCTSKADAFSRKIRLYRQNLLLKRHRNKIQWKIGKRKISANLDSTPIGHQIILL